MSIIFRTYKISIFKNPTVKKFILFAIGEIFLVMFGILLALEVDNWKENRKSFNIERVALMGIYDDLHQNRNKIQSIIKNDSMRIIGNQKLITLLKDPLSDYHQDYDTLLGKFCNMMLSFAKECPTKTWIILARSLKTIRSELKLPTYTTTSSKNWNNRATAARNC